MMLPQWSMMGMSEKYHERQMGLPTDGDRGTDKYCTRAKDL